MSKTLTQMLDYLSEKIVNAGADEIGVLTQTYATLHACQSTNVSTSYSGVPDDAPPTLQETADELFGLHKSGLGIRIPDEALTKKSPPIPMAMSKESAATREELLKWADTYKLAGRHREANDLRRMVFLLFGG